MLINRNVYGYSDDKKYIVGRCFVDSSLAIFNGIKSSAIPTLRGVGSYLSTNKDQLLKPLIGAVGTLGAKALMEGIPALINKIANKNKLVSAAPPEVDPAILEYPIYNKLLKNMTTLIQVSNIIGSGVKKFKIFFRLKNILFYYYKWKIYL